MAALAFCLLMTVACEKKQVRAVPPVLVPSIETEPEPARQPAQPAENAGTAQTAPSVQPQAPEQRPKPKPRKPAPRRTVPPQTSEPAKTESPKPAQPGSSAQITADVPRAAVQSQRQNTENLLYSSQDKLAHISHSLNDGEQGMLRQARNYLVQSTQALQAGDIERAYNLAVKANLLANELAK